MRALIFPVFLSLLSSCSTLQEDPGLDVAVVGVRVDQTTLLETTARFTVRISNESPEPLALDGSVHKFYLNGQYIGKGMTSDTIQVPRLSSMTQVVPVHLRNIAIATRLRPVLESRTMDYRVASTLYVMNGSRSRRCRVVHEGQVALQDFQPNLRGAATAP
jgi:LEA14-like dessication related protein